MHDRTPIGYRNLPSGRLKAAFTLVELLVVVAIIAILAALLMPALSKAKERAKQSTCMHNLAQLCQIQHLYSMDHDGTCAPHWPPMWINTLAKAGYMGNQYGNAGKLICPSNPTYYSAYPGVKLAMSASAVAVDFRVAAITQPAHTILFLDTGIVKFWANGKCDYAWDSYRYPSTLDPDHITYRIGDWHNNGADAVYYDGHVEWHARGTLQSEWFNPQQ